MTKTSQTPPWWVAPTNRVFAGMRRVGLPTPGFVRMLTVRGRRSGKLRTTPVAPFTVDGQLYLIGIFAKCDWIANARADGNATLTRGRRVESVRLVELPPEQRGPIMRAFPREVPRGKYIFVRAGIVEHPTPDDFEKGASKAAVFRVERR
jgi:deazaflavin-dependent oxidoreductase (nitroreductase family)